MQNIFCPQRLSNLPLYPSRWQAGMSLESLKPYILLISFLHVLAMLTAISIQGSGKTLAYGLPILQHLLSQPPPMPGKRRPVRALILAPTRELSLQVSAHLNACLNRQQENTIVDELNGTVLDHEGSSKKGKGNGKKMDAPSTANPPKSPPHVSVAAIVGGMSAQKQRRILDRGVDVLVATPGRLWDIMEEVSYILIFTSV